MKWFAITGMLLVIVVNLAQGQQTQTAQPGAAAVVFAKATPWGRDKPSLEYDKDTDSTTVRLILDGFDLTTRQHSTLTLYYSFQGRQKPASPPDSISLIATTETPFGESGVISSARRLDQIASADGERDALFWRVPGETISVPGGLSFGNDVNVERDGRSVTTANFSAEIPTAAFARIVTPPGPVQFAGGNVNFSIGEDWLRTVRNFVAHMAPGAPLL